MEDYVQTNGKAMSKLLDDVGIRGKTPGKWFVVGKIGKKPTTFEDRGTINNYTGLAFRLYEENDEHKDYFYPPSQIRNQIVHDDKYPENVGLWVPYTPQVVNQERTLVQTGHIAPKSLSNIREMTLEDLIKYIISNAGVQEFYACIVGQLGKSASEKELRALEELKELMESKLPEEEEEGGEVTSKRHTTRSRSRSPKRSPSPTASPKMVDLSTQGLIDVQSPQDQSLIASLTPAQRERLKQLTEQHKILLEQRSNTQTQLRNATSDLARNIKKTNLDSIQTDIDAIEDEIVKFGFGRARLKPYRSKKALRRRSSKRMKLLFTRRTSGFKPLLRKNVGEKSLKKALRRRKSKKTIKKKRFGSSIYGLQGGLQSGPIYSGVYPMHLKVNEQFPNLYNVKRSYKLNEFGKKNTKRSPRKRKSLLVEVINHKSTKRRYGSGLYGCGHKFGCECGSGGTEKKKE